MQKQVLITGAGTGIGMACVERFIDSDWRVLAHYNKSASGLKRIQKRVGSRRLILKKADFMKIQDVRIFLSSIRREKFDAMVNNAAVYDFSHKGKSRIEKAQKVMLVNTIVPTLIAECVLVGMKKRRQGKIVNISSIGAKYGSNLRSVFYGISKRGIEALTNSLAREGAPCNILVNTVRPGVTATSFHNRIQKDLKKRVQKIPLKRMAQSQEVADLIYFLCAENTYITNEIIAITGGE